MDYGLPGGLIKHAAYVKVYVGMVMWIIFGLRIGLDDGAFAYWVMA